MDQRADHEVMLSGGCLSICFIFPHFSDHFEIFQDMWMTVGSCGQIPPLVGTDVQQIVLIDKQNVAVRMTKF